MPLQETDLRRADLRVLLVTSWDTPCGIAAHSAMLKEAVERADPGIQVRPDAAALDPVLVLEDYLAPRGTAAAGDYLIHLNHHDALHSRWTPAYVQDIVGRGIPVLVTYHDTKATIQECPKLEALSRVASSMVVHEPVEGLQAIYWRQPIPAPAMQPTEFTTAHLAEQWVKVIGDPAYQMRVRQSGFKAYAQQPVLGTVGFDFPWKNFDRLASLTHDLGWAFVLLSNNMTEARVQEIKRRNPRSLVVTGYLPTPVIVNYLAGCDATAFPYECANTGTSGAIRLGLAALRPVFAFQGCRQFRDLYLEFQSGVNLDPGIQWIYRWEDFADQLRHQYVGYVHPKVRAFAHQDSWYEAGYNYANLYRMLVGVGGSTL